MKKKILLIIVMFMFITNVNALTFNVNITNIEEEGTGTLGTIKSIDQTNKTLDVLFEDIGAEVSFNVTVTNTGDRAGTLREISFVPENDKIEYTSNLPENGLAINGNDTNTVTITGRVLEGATNGTSSSQIKLSYRYDEGSCPEGEILTEDESMCLCPEGTERNENGMCVEPRVTCKTGEIYNETKKICEKKAVVPSNPKTLDNIILVTLLFIVSGLGIYAVMFKRLNTNKKKITVGIITGIITLGASFTVLAGVFGLDNLLSAIINPITKSEELTLTVNEEIDLIETWDGECSLDVSELIPSNIFQGGIGTKNNPYQIKTAEQLSCLAKSVNNGTTYEGEYIKQTRNIKLNDKLNKNISSGATENLHVWISAGYSYYDYDLYEEKTKSFSGSYDGNNHIISGLYLTNDSSEKYRGLFGHARNATFKNMILTDVYINTDGYTGALLGLGDMCLNLYNITTYGNAVYNDDDGAGIMSSYTGDNANTLTIENTTNNINLSCNESCAGILYYGGNAYGVDNKPGITLKNNTNNGNITFNNSISQSGGIAGYIVDVNYLLGDNNVNNGNMFFKRGGGHIGGIIGYIYDYKAELSNSYNTGDITGVDGFSDSGMLYGGLYLSEPSILTNSFNSGVLTIDNETGNNVNDTNYDEINDGNFGGIVGRAFYVSISNCYNTGNLNANTTTSGISGIVGYADAHTSVDNSYNRGNITGFTGVSGIMSYGVYDSYVNKSYNTGKITSFGYSGGIVGNGSEEVIVTNSYNTGDIITNGEGYTAGICGTDCSLVKNCYNRGNITATNRGRYIAGITGYQTRKVENVYNSGNIIFTNENRYGNNGSIAGIGITGYYMTVKNAYNLGDVTFHTITKLNAYEPNPQVSGISTEADVTNSVNKGKITIKIDEPLGSRSLLQINGISYNSSTNSFNAGQVEIDDSLLDVKISNDGLNHKIEKGQITQSDGSGNKWNTDPNGHATGCFGIWDSCNQETDLAVGQYTTEEAPSILSIINGDNAFNTELDVDGLPTLKAFNE